MRRLLSCLCCPGLALIEFHMDLIVRNVTLPSGGGVCDVGVLAGRIESIAPKIQAKAVQELEGNGRLLSPPFVDAHFHLDATLSLGLPRLNRSGTLLEGIALWGELKPTLTHEAVIERAMAYCDWAVGRGLLAIRSHVDVCDDRLLAVEALLEVKRRVSPYIDLQLVAFPQDGLFRSNHGMRNLVRALDLGIEGVGGIPHFETSRAEGERVPGACACCANWRLNAGFSSTFTAMRPTILIRGTLRRSHSRAVGSVSEAGSRAPT